MIALVTDSNSQLPADLRDRFGVHVVPLVVVVDGDEHAEGIDLDDRRLLRAAGGRGDRLDRGAVAGPVRRGLRGGGRRRRDRRSCRCTSGRTRRPRSTPRAIAAADVAGPGRDRRHRDRVVPDRVLRVGRRAHDRRGRRRRRRRARGTCRSSGMSTTCSSSARSTWRDAVVGSRPAPTWATACPCSRCTVGRWTSWRWSTTSTPRSTRWSRYVRERAGASPQLVGSRPRGRGRARRRARRPPRTSAR